MKRKAKAVVARTRCASIDARAVSIRSRGGVERLPNDAVIVQMGGAAPADVLRSFGVEIVTKYGSTEVRGAVIVRSTNETFR